MKRTVTTLMIFCSIGAASFLAMIPDSSPPPNAEELILTHSNDYRFLVLSQSEYDSSYLSLKAYDLLFDEPEVRYVPSRSDVFLIIARKTFFDCLFPAHIYTDCTPKQHRKKSGYRVAEILNINKILERPFRAQDVEAILISHALQSRPNTTITPDDFELSVDVL